MIPIIRCPDSPIPSDFLILTSLYLRTFSQSLLGGSYFVANKDPTAIRKDYRKAVEPFFCCLCGPNPPVSPPALCRLLLSGRQRVVNITPYLLADGCFRSCHLFRLNLPYFSALLYTNQLRKRTRIQPEQIVQAIRYQICFSSPLTSLSCYSGLGQFSVSAFLCVKFCFSDHVRCWRSPRDHRRAMIRSCFPDTQIARFWVVSSCLRVIFVFPCEAFVFPCPDPLSFPKMELCSGFLHVISKLNSPTTRVFQAADYLIRSISSYHNYTGTPLT